MGAWRTGAPLSGAGSTGWPSWGLAQWSQPVFDPQGNYRGRAYDAIPGGLASLGNAAWNWSAAQRTGTAPSQFAWNLFGGKMSPGGAGGSGSGTGGFWGGTGGFWGSGGVSSIQDLIKKQEAENQRARAFNIAQWTPANEYLRGVTSRAAADPMTVGARDIASQLLASPEAITDSIQQQIVNRARAQMEGQAQAAQEQALGVMMSSGQMSDSALGGMQERMARQRMASLAGLTGDLEVQRALRRNQDMQAAAGLARQLGLDASALDMGVAGTWMTNLMHDTPDDYTGWAALLSPAVQGAQLNIGRAKVQVGGQGQGSGLGGFGQPIWTESGSLSPASYRDYGISFPRQSWTSSLQAAPADQHGVYIGPRQPDNRWEDLWEDA